MGDGTETLAHRVAEQVRRYRATVELLSRMPGLGVCSVITADRRREAAKKGWALPDGSYPIFDVKDLADAIRLSGHGAAGTKAIRDHIRKQAKRLNREDLIPDSWSD